MARYWVIRTDKAQMDYGFAELKLGRLRQGWGYQENQDLNIIYGICASGGILDEDQKICRRGNRRLLSIESDGVHSGDFIIIPNLPVLGQWLIAVAKGKYEYKIDPVLKDYGHILYVDLLNANKPIDPNSEFVAAPLRETMRNQLRMWNIDAYKDYVDELIASIRSNADIGIPSTLSSKLALIKGQIVDLLVSNLKRRFQGSEFELPIEVVLEVIYGKGNVEFTAGSAENGADFICTFTDELGVSSRVAVQVKHWREEIADLTPLNQIERAYNHYEKISAGAIITLADSFTVDFKQKHSELENKLNIPIKIIDKYDLSDLMLKYISEVVNVGEEFE